jgi:hypothetical protein
VNAREQSPQSKSSFLSNAFAQTAQAVSFIRSLPRLCFRRWNNRLRIRVLEDRSPRNQTNCPRGLCSIQPWTRLGLVKLNQTCNQTTRCSPLTIQPSSNALASVRHVQSSKISRQMDVPHDSRSMET